MPRAKGQAAPPPTNAMDRLVKGRTPVRASITRTIGDIELELANAPPNEDDLKLKLQKLEKLMGDVVDWDEKVKDELLDNGTDLQYEQELLIIEDYEDKIRAAKLKAEKVLTPPNKGPPGSQHDPDQHTKSFKLPKIQLKKFGGDIKDWLSWWSQFKKIDEDTNLHPSDKFQYLHQCMIIGSRARGLVESFPMTDENYPKAINSLKERFGKEEILVEVYVRELLKLVITTAKAKERPTLSSLYDSLETQLRALESLGVSQDQTTKFLYPMVESCLPEEILIAWQRSTLYSEDGSTLVPPKSKMDFLTQFLRQEVECEEKRKLVRDGYETSTPTKDKDHHKKSQQQQVKIQKFRSDQDDFPTVAGLFVTSECLFCEKSNHPSHKCFKADKMPLQEKRKKLMDKERCTCCFEKGHFWRQCKSTVKCAVCSKRHYDVMCPHHPNHQSIAVHYENKETTASQSNIQCQTDVLLKTLLVRVHNKEKNKSSVVRLLFDEGSQRSYITFKTAELLNSKPVGHETSRNVLFDGSVTDYEKVNKHQIILSDLRTNKKMEVVLREKQVIGGIIPRVPQGPWLQQLQKKKIWITDQSLAHVDSPDIEILIGSDYWGSIMTGKLIHLKCGLTAAETTMGWTLCGPVPKQESMASNEISMFLTEDNLSQMWTLETLGIRDPIEVQTKKDEELAAKEHFVQTVTQLDDGRYSVKLPWMDKEITTQKLGAPLHLPTNKQAAESRLKSTTKKLMEKGKYGIYDGIFKSWLEEGIIERVNVENINDNLCHYLPHHPVFKESLTTPVRPVFDASCKIKRCPSLNDCLYKGPNLMELIPSVLMRFREKKVGIISDIRKAFQMIDVQESDRDYLRFLWWEDPSQNKVQVFRHKRVVFGVNCSPFLLAAVIEHHINQVDEHMKSEAQQLLKALYVDNCVTSKDTHEEYEVFKSISTQIMREAKMELRQWECSSVESTTVGFYQECGLVGDRESTSKESSTNPTTMVLGLIWNKDEDTLSCDVKCDIKLEKSTKRSVLSIIHQVFDPIGFTSPAMLQPKMLMQRAWKTKTGWDKELPEEEAYMFQRWCQELPSLNDIRIPRQMMNSRQNLEIHTFCDASKDAYAAVVFLRCDYGNKVNIQLALAKSRVAPLNTPTIPRLELMGCLIASRLTLGVKEALNLDNDIPTVYWSDSSSALAWIKRSSNWGTFVGNRVRDILKNSKEEEWRFVPGTLNPADLPSRGCSPRQLLESRWWEGPQWLKSPREEWPTFQEQVDEELVDQERKKTTAAQISTVSYPPPRFSSYQKNVAVYGWIRRFISSQRAKLQKKQWNPSNHLTVGELRMAEKDILKQIQSSFLPEMTNIYGIPVMKGEDGLFRVKTKLLYGQDKEEFKYPILLSKSHPLVELLIRDLHNMYSHAGVQFLMGKLREKYWIPQSRRTIRQVIKTCAKCQRFQARAPHVDPMAGLPENRVTIGEPFQITGVDLAGPLPLKNGSKAWIVLFTCAVYRGIHLDVVTEISTEAFLESLERFINQYGRPNTVYSDNGTNFVGAVNLFKKVDWKKVESECQIKKIQWIFNPPTAAWWGGWWERLVRSVKDLLKRMLGQAKLTYDQLRTCLSSAAAAINSRPLTTVTEDQEDLIPLTPAMFLKGGLDSSFPESLEIKPTDLQSQYRKIKNLQFNLQSRFRKEYLAQLVQRQKSQKSTQFKVGDIVLVGAENKKRFEWPLARILQLIPGKDGVLRVAMVKTAHVTLQRPLQRLYSLEISSPEDNPSIASAIKKGKVKKSQNQKKVVIPHPVPVVQTKSGRVSKKPSRYGTWNN